MKLLLLLTVAVATVSAGYFQEVLGQPGAANCTERWFTQYTDHFTFGSQPGWPLTYQQRFQTYDKYYKPGGPIFFYVGNEASISVFTDIAGLMWENAAAFNATLVFAEHRFYGKSFPQCERDCWGLLSTMQAMADYSVLLTNLTGPGGMYHDSKGVITFGGSYGGMLSAWMRMKYPNIVTGAIACSAPIALLAPDWDPASYWKVITRDATEYGGAAPKCARNIYDSIQAAFAMLDTDEGAQQLSTMFGSCSPLPKGDASKSLFGYYVQGAFDTLGMGDYPFQTDFMFGTPQNPAPAWPMRVACTHLAFENATNQTLLAGLAAVMNMFYNVTNNVPCNNLTQNPTTSGAWDYMVCTESIVNELPYFAAKGWPNDMFYPQPVWTHEMYNQHCNSTYGVTPRFGWLDLQYGGPNLNSASNIVFSNGLLDPWHSGGILHNVSDTVKSYIIPDGAHHLDLFFTAPEDPPAVATVRRIEMEHVRDWLSKV
jgi:pimeloyl-ACP methyl ester carboxylesterase